MASLSPRHELRAASRVFFGLPSKADDVDYLAVQGFWVCTPVAILSFAILLATRQPILAAAVFLLYYLGGAGVREHSRFAATIVFTFYVVDWVASPGARLSVVRILITALLLSNLRATWVAAKWQVGSEEATLPPRFHETLKDKFVDVWPAWLWPKVKIIYYIYSLGFLVLVIFGLAMMSSGHLNNQ